MDTNELIKALRPEDQERMRPQAEALAEMLRGGGMGNLHPVLKPWVFDTVLGPMVKHPFAYRTLGGDDGLLVGQANDFYAWKIKIRREYLDTKNWWGYLMAHERPYRMLALEKLWGRGKISRDKMSELLADFWTDTEMPQRNQEGPLDLFRAAGFTTDDPEGWEKLKSKTRFKLWRGVDYEFELTADGPSWTFDKKTALFFAKRFGAKGDVFSYYARPDEALAYLTGRDEAEIILDFDGKSDRSRIRLEEDTMLTEEGS